MPETLSECLRRNCPYGASEEDALLKLEYDLYYLQNASLMFDLRIMLKTISIVISARGSR
jgi:lipopolysaccharide/colanic/teichoic acid biosynthesis glycosyltransferase